MLRSRRHLVAVVLVLGGFVATATPTGAQPAPTDPVAPGDLEVADDGGISPDGEPITGSKGTSSTVAETDPDLLARTDGAVVEVVVKLDYDAIAVYAGGRDGLAATSPSVTGDPLSEADVTTGAYARQVARDEAAIVDAISAAVPAAEIGQSLRVVYGGVAARIPANQVEALLAVDGVVAVQSDTPEQLLTDSSPSFIGADTVWDQVGGQATAGSGVIFGTLDSGVWPEHPQLADTGATGTPPAKADATPRPCQFGDNPLTPATDVFACNDKLISGQAFMATYNAQVGDDTYTNQARDSNGHGTHTATTAAGNAVDDATVLGTDRGPISGLAPGAWVSAYKVCGPAGCYSSDSAAAVQQAILDGVDVINFSISGGSDPSTDPVELAFLDAYAAGVFVAASAGNSGPGADTADHNGPWVTTVAATSPNRDWASTLTVSGGAGLTLPGLTITDGVGPLPIVLGSAPPYNNAQCTTPAPPGIFVGKIVACERSPGRVLKGFNIKQGGAAGMVLYNATPFNVSAENHWLPTVHVQDGPALLAHLGANPGATATFTDGTATPATGDEMAAFSSRGPGGLTVKPDVGAPGQQILAGHTPTPDDPSGGPPGNYYRVLDGTSMAAPHVAGAAILLRDAHPDWTPGQVRSALTGSASPTVFNGGSPATPFDTGSGRIQVDAAIFPGLLLDETASAMAAMGNDPTDAVHLNLAQVSAPSMPGRVRTTRTVTNPGAPTTYTAATTVGADSSIAVTPETFTLGTGGSQEVEIVLESSAAVGTQVFGAIVLAAPGRNDTRLPVAFKVTPSEIAMTGLGCTPDPVDVPQTSTCSYEIANGGPTDGLVDLRAEGDAFATVTGANLGATTSGGVATADDVALAGSTPGVPDTAPGEVYGYVPLDGIGITPTPILDESLLNFNVPSYVFGDRAYDRIGVSANGYIVVGGGDGTADSRFNPPPLGDPTRPNNVLAPFWTDLDGTGQPGIFVATLTDGILDWIVVEWRVVVNATSSTRVFQTWIGINGSEDVTFAYDPTNLPAAPPPTYGLTVGAENAEGAGTSSLAFEEAPTEDMRVTTGDITPGATVQWDVTVQGTAEGTASIEAEATSDAHPGTVVAVDQLEVDVEPLPVVTDDPDDLTVDALATATFTAAATGGTLARWETLPAGSATWETVPGATTTTLSFTAHGADDGNRYRAVFANTGGDETTTAAATLTIDLLETTTVLTVDPTAPVRPQDVTLTATVTPGTATGTVQFAVDGTDEGAPVALVGGEAELTVSDLAADDHTFTATYSGDGDHEGSDDDADLTVDPMPLPVVTDDPDDLTVDALQTATFTTAATGGTFVRWETQPGGAGPWETVAWATTATLSFTAHGTLDGSTFRAVFANDDGAEIPTDAATLTVDRLESTTSVSVSPTNPARGQDVTFTATVTPGTATGTVQFALDGTDVGGPVALVGGTATSPPVPDIAAGDHTVTATYGGDDDHDPSDDDADLTVARSDSSTTIVEITSGVIGEDTPVEATITVTPVPTGGTVELTVDGMPYGSPLTLDDTGTVETTLTGLAPGSRTIVAGFTGDDDLDPSEDEVTITVYPAEEAFVRRAYQVVLGRNGDESGIAYWVGRIDGGLDRTTLIDNLVVSAEGRNRLVGRVYLTALDRPSSASDRAYWSGRVAGGMTAEDLLATLLASPEAVQNTGGTPEDFAEKLYDAHLVRTPTAGEVEYWAGRAAATLNQAQLRQLAKQFGRSAEATRVALSEAARLVCGTTTIPSGIADQLLTRWVTYGRNPLRLAGDTLALLCPGSSAPPT